MRGRVAAAERVQDRPRSVQSQDHQAEEVSLVCAIPNVASTHCQRLIYVDYLTRYLVRPAMGIIEAGSSLTIQFIIPPAEVEGLCVFVLSLS